MKFKVGDKVKYLDLTGVIGCIHNKTAYMSECVKDNGEVQEYPSGGNCIEHKNMMGFGVDSMTLVKGAEKSKPPKFLLQSKGEEAAERFESMTEVRKRIKERVEARGDKVGDFEIIEIKKIYKVKLTTRVEIK